MASPRHTCSHTVLLCQSRSLLLVFQLTFLPAAATVAATALYRWLEAAYPAVPTKVSRKVLDDGRNDFTLSRTRHNWRRLLALKEGWAPVAAVMGHLCRWENIWHSLGVYAVILLLGVFPSQVGALAGCNQGHRY